MEFISKDKEQIVLFHITLRGRNFNNYKWYRLSCLNVTDVYCDKNTGAKYSGYELMNIGFSFVEKFDSSSDLIILNKIDEKIVK